MSRCPSQIENTCPFIDEVISYLEEEIEVSDSNDARRRDYMIEIMERIRKMNEGLRTWGVERFEEKNDLESDNEDKANRIQELEYEMEDLHAKIEEYEKEISRLESEVSDLNVELEDLQNS